MAFFVSCIFAINIGASGAAATMGVAYGSGAIKKMHVALILCSVGIFLGAVIGGGEVIKTIGSGLIDQQLLTVQIVIIILASATLSLFFANILGIPLSTSEVTVGSVIGVGIAYQSVYFHQLLWIVALWIIVPVIAFIITVTIQKITQYFFVHKMKKFSKIFTILLIITGFFEAFSAGMNNIANAVGPLVGAGMLSEMEGKLLGGLFVALGAMMLGRKVVETNGKRITKFTKIEGLTISATGASLVILASLFGIPIPMTQITTSSILGIGFVQEGKRVFQKEVVQRLIKIWVVSPLVSLIISYSLIQAIVFSNWYSFFMVVIVFITTIVFLNLTNSILKQSKQIKLRRNEQ